VKVSVADTGPGIPAEYHIEVFDDFFRLPQSESTAGMGLGLAIARRLVANHGWQDLGGKASRARVANFRSFSPLLPPATVTNQGKSK